MSMVGCGLSYNMSRQLMVFQELKKHIIQQHGCWRLVHQQQKSELARTLQTFTETQTCTSKSSSWSLKLLTLLCCHLQVPHTLQLLSENNMRHLLVHELDN